MAATDKPVFEQAFASRTARSRALFEGARAVLPGGVNSTARTTYAGWEPYPLFAAGGEGPYLIDVDGNRYIDYLLALGPLILGHRHPAVAARVAEETARLGTMFALPYELEQHVARKFLAAVPTAEMVRFTNSGSEAVAPPPDAPGCCASRDTITVGRTPSTGRTSHAPPWPDRPRRRSPCRRVRACRPASPRR